MDHGVMGTGYAAIPTILHYLPTYPSYAPGKLTSSYRHLAMHMSTIVEVGGRKVATTNP